jgi:hypothetical protein
MKKLLLALVLFSSCCILSFYSCRQSNTTKVAEIENKKFEIDTSRYSIIAWDSFDNWAGFHDATRTILANNEIQIIEQLLNECIDKYNPSQQAFFDSLSKANPGADYLIQTFIIDLKMYKRQYVPVINSKGQKEVWVNCFRMDDMDIDDFSDWRNMIVYVSDGGNSFFNLKINLATKTYYDFRVNGLG